MEGDRSYGVAKALFTFIEVVGFCAAGAGAIFAILSAIKAGEMFGRSSGMAILMASVPFLVLAAAGLIAMALVQSARANVDTAEMTQELLRLAREGKG